MQKIILVFVSFTREMILNVSLECVARVTVGRWAWGLTVTDELSYNGWVHSTHRFLSQTYCPCTESDPGLLHTSLSTPHFCLMSLLCVPMMALRLFKMGCLSVAHWFSLDSIIKCSPCEYWKCLRLCFFVTVIFANLLNVRPWCTLSEVLFHPSLRVKKKLELPLQRYTVLSQC